MLTLSSPPRQKLPCFIYFFPAVWPIATSFLEGGRSGKGKPGSFNKNRKRYLKKVPHEDRLYWSPCNFFLFFEQRVHLICFSVNLVVFLNYHTLASE